MSVSLANAEAERPKVGKVAVVIFLSIQFDTVKKKLDSCIITERFKPVNSICSIKRGPYFASLICITGVIKMSSNLIIMFALAGSLLLQSCDQQKSLPAADKESITSSLAKTSDVVEINNVIDSTVTMPVGYDWSLSCVQLAQKYKRNLDIAQMRPEQSIFVQQGDIFIYSSGANKNLKKLDQSLNAGTVQTCGIDIEDVYVRSGVNVFMHTNIKVIRSPIPYYFFETTSQSALFVQP